MLRIEDLQVHYGDFVAVQSVSFSVESGTITALIGANGAGKSSLLNAVAGLVRPTAGKVYLDEEDITGYSADRIVHRGLSLVPQGGRCFARMSVQDNLLMGSYPKSVRKDAAASLERVLGIFPPLKEKLMQPAGSLSGGQRQMLAIGRALMSRPRYMMFDEMSLGLAPIAIRDLYNRIQQLNKEEGIAIILVDQDTTRAMQIADECFVMMKGGITLRGKAADLSYDAVRTAYFGI